MFYGIIVAMFSRLRKNTTCRIFTFAIKDFRHRLRLKTERCWAGDLLCSAIAHGAGMVDLHREELMADWELAKEGIEPFELIPLNEGE